MNNIEILEHIAIAYIDDEEFSQYVSPEGRFIINKQLAQAIENLIQENKELKEKINKSIEFINDDDTFFNDGESWQNVLHIERILKGE